MHQINFGFIGLGLIGGSIAKALRRSYPDCFIIAYDKNIEALTNAKSELVISKAADDISEEFSDCDYIFLCAPVSDNNDNLIKLSNIIGSETIITDVGSVKSPIRKAISEANLDKHFIGGHPMAGSERFGYANSKPALLENAYYILTPSEQVSTEAVSSMQTLIQSIGAIPLVLSADMHDFVTGAISHLPHVISAALVNLVKNEDTKEGTMKLIAAGGFKDITRISSSSPVMWQQICMTNKDNISKLLELYIKALTDIKAQIDCSASDELYSFFENAREYRESFINANHGPIKAEYVITVDIADKPGAIAAIASLLSMHGVNIKNIGINHNRELAEGALRIEFYSDKDTNEAITVMTDHGYSIHSKANL